MVAQGRVGELPVPVADSFGRPIVPLDEGLGRVDAVDPGEALVREPVLGLLDHPSPVHRCGGDPGAVDRS